MNRIIFAFVLSFAAGSAMADGFAPWNGHTALTDSAETSSTSVPASGFAPWRDRSPIIDRIDAAAALGANDVSVFRPWLMAS